MPLQPMHEFYRRPIPADELRLASSFRLLERTEQGAGVAVVAPSFSAGVTPTLRLPRALGTVTLRVPRFNAQEVATVAAMLADAGAIAAVPSEHTLKRALALTNGNAKELREYSTALFTDSDPLGLSLGYKALAAAKVKYATTLR